MTRDEMQEITENTSNFVLGLFSVSSLVLKVISIIDSFRNRKEKYEKNNSLVEEEKFE